MSLPNDNTPITLKLPLASVNKVLLALGQRPWIEVNDLIAEIRKQTELQLEPKTPEAPSEA